jgi:hypothetical protein
MNQTEQNTMAGSMQEPYGDAHTHLLDELRWLNRLLAAQVLRLRRVDFYKRVKRFRGSSLRRRKSKPCWPPAFLKRENCRTMMSRTRSWQIC